MFFPHVPFTDLFQLQFVADTSDILMFPAGLPAKPTHKCILMMIHDDDDDDDDDISFPAIVFPLGFSVWPESDLEVHESSKARKVETTKQNHSPQTPSFFKAP